MSNAAAFLPDRRFLRAVEPAALLAMSGTPPRCPFGPKARRGRDRGRPPDSALAPLAAAPIHPSAVPRLGDHGERETEFAGFVADLEAVGAALGASRR